MLSWIRKHLWKAGSIEERRTKAIQFTGAQTGAAERELMEKFLPVLSEDAGIRFAFLLRANLADDNQDTVILGIFPQVGNPMNLVERLGVEFRRSFAGGQHLDITFFTDDQLNSALLVCKPFYSAT